MAGRGASMFVLLKSHVAADAVAVGTALAVVSGALAVADKGPFADNREPVAVVEPQTPGPLEAPDAASAALTARLRNAPVEVLDARTETKTLYANPDGSSTLEDAVAAVRVKQGKDWVPVDTTLVERNGVLEPKASPVKVKVRKDRSSSLALFTDGATSAEIGWKANLPAPTVDGPSAVYAVDANTEVRLSVTSHGLEQFTILKAKPASVPTVTLPLKLTGLTAKAAAGGGVELINAAGKTVFEIPQPQMWGAERDPQTEEATRRSTVAMSLTPTKTGADLTLTPDAAFLNDPGVRYPVTIDPSFISTGTVRDSYVASNATSTNYNDETLKFGLSTAGVKWRSYAWWDTPALPEAGSITRAQVRVYNNATNSCAAQPVYAYPITTPSWTNPGTTWNVQPSVNTSATYAGGASFAHGTDPGCPNATDYIDVTKMTQAWVAGTLPNYGMSIRASETNSAGGKYICSMNPLPTGTPGAACDQESRMPTLVVDYNAAPYAAGGRLVSPCYTACTTGTDNAVAILTNAKRPLLRGRARDKDPGARLRVDYELYAGHNPTVPPATPVATGNVADLASYAYGNWPVPNDLADGNYTYRIRAHDGLNYSGWNSGNWLKFTVDTTAPAAPTVSSTLYKNDGSWNGNSTTAGSFVLTPASGTATLDYWIDDAAPTTVATGSAVTKTLTPPTDGSHTLYVQAKDTAGNPSTLTTYNFNAGAGAVTSPLDGDQTDRRFTLSAEARASLTGVTFQYRRGAADAWADIPTEDVKNAGNPITWPVTLNPPTNGIASSPPLQWDAGLTLRHDTDPSNAFPADGEVEVRANFGTGSTVTEPVTSVVNQRYSGASTESIGPAEVNLLTGDTSITSTEGGPFGLSVSRTATSRDTTVGDEIEGVVAPFGPQWAVGGMSGGADYKAVQVTSPTSAQVVLPDNSVIEFLQTNIAGPTWKAAEADELTLTGNGTSAPFKLSDTSGSVTTFTGAGPTYLVDTATTPGGAAAGDTTSYSYQTVMSTPPAPPVTKQRLRYLIAPTSAVATPSSCINSPSTRPNGCRVLEIIYSSADVTARATGLQLQTTKSGVTTNTDLAAYTYNGSGQLTKASDPRATGLSTEYTYDNGRIATLTPAGLLPWTFTYDTTDPGRLNQVSRPTLTPGSATQIQANQDAHTSLVYNVPLAGQTAPRDMSPTATAAWGQTGPHAAVTGTAIFPPDSIPTGTGVDWARASVAYLDINGQTTNSLSPGNNLSYTAYDDNGNTVQELTPGNLKLALAPSTDPRLIGLGLQGDTTTSRAQQLSDITLYDAASVREMESYGPLHLLTAPGAEAPSPGRAHRTNIYDQGNPNSLTDPNDIGPVNLVTSQTAGARMGGAAQDVDVRTVTTGYDWTTGLPTSSTTDPGTGNILTSTTSYDAQGRVIKTTPAGSDGTDPAASVTTYYTGDATASVPACRNKPEWADLVCQTAPAGTIARGPAGQPTRTVATLTTYTVLGDQDVVTETTADGSGTPKTRTTIATYDAAARPATVTTAGGIGAAIPAVTETYDTATGLPTTTSAGGATITKGYDSLGRVRTYTDADGATTTTTYDNLDRPTGNSTPGIGSSTLTYSTSGPGSDARGLPTRLTDSVAGDFTATYDAEGALTSQTLPGGIAMTQTLDPTGTVTRRSWTRASVGPPPPSSTSKSP